MVYVLWQILHGDSSRPCAEVLLEANEVVNEVYFIAKGLVHGLVEAETTICAMYSHAVLTVLKAGGCVRDSIWTQKVS